MHGHIRGKGSTHRLTVPFKSAAFVFSKRQPRCDVSFVVKLRDDDLRVRCDVFI